jgi:anthranilate phosphoribosyltransferase
MRVLARALSGCKSLSRKRSNSQIAPCPKRAILDCAQTGASRDIVLLNAAAALLVAGQADDLTSGVALARTSIESGAAKGVLDSLIAITN